MVSNGVALGRKIAQEVKKRSWFMTSHLLILLMPGAGIQVKGTRTGTGFSSVIFQRVKVLPNFLNLNSTLLAARDEFKSL
jgi:hypothetical protein